MDKRSEGRTGLSPDPDASFPMAEDVATLLRRLADAREEAEQVRAQVQAAENRADRAEAEATALRTEIEGMTATLISLDQRLDESATKVAATESRVSELEGLSQELERLRASEARSVAALSELEESTSWKLTAPLRRLGGRSHPGR